MTLADLHVCRVHYLERRLQLQCVAVERFDDFIIFPFASFSFGTVVILELVDFAVEEILETSLGFCSQFYVLFQCCSYCVVSGLPRLLQNNDNSDKAIGIFSEIND